MGLVDLENKPEWFTTIVNPFTKKVPAMAYGGPAVPADQPSSESTKLAESGVLLEFLADIYPSAKLLPADPVQRAQARFFIKKVNTAVIQSWIAFQKGQGTKEEFLAGLEATQNLLPETGFAVGELAVAPQFGRVEVALREDLGPWEQGVGPDMYKVTFEGTRFARWVRY
ncbi:hypothetical protein PENSPDRAFT_748853 [Peniophora sp. CONT]|nr:hypothetical protein PENSPDRAFT_748853 [Peniophora sp. CONT]